MWLFDETLWYSWFSLNGIKDNIKLIPRNLKFLRQRLIRGWSDEETWSLDYTLSKWLLPRLVRYKEISDQFGFPAELTSAKWSEILHKMIIAFKLRIKDDLEWGTDKRYIEGFELFCKYFSQLWW